MFGRVAHLLQILKQDSYYYYLFYRVSNCKNHSDILKVLKNISFFYYYTNTDQLCNVLTNAFKRFPLSEEKVQLFSLLQQEYEHTLGIENFVTTLLWTTILKSIEERQKLLTYNSRTD